jgi:hypothetical protein
MARKAVRSIEPLKWMAVGSALTLLIVWGPHKLIDQGQAASSATVTWVRAAFD